MEKELRERVDAGILNKNTRKQIDNFVKWYRKNMGIESEFEMGMIKINFNKLKKLIESEKYSENTVNCYMGIIRMLYRITEIKMSKKINNYCTSYERLHKLNKRKNIKKELNEIDFEGLVKYMRENLRYDRNNRYISNYIKLLITLFYNNEIPLRGNELSEIEYEDKKTNNYINIKKSKLYIRNHKTSKQIGDKIFNTTEEINNLVKEMREKFKNKYIICKNKKPYDEPTTSNAISKLIKRMTKEYKLKDLSINLLDDNKKILEKQKQIEQIKGNGIHSLRHNYVCDKYSQIDSKNGVDIILKTMDQMGHTSMDTTTINYYKKHKKEFKNKKVIVKIKVKKNKNKKK